MSDDKQPQPRRPADSGPPAALVAAGAVLLAVVCCAGPVLLAAGALGALGAWLANPWMIGAGITVLMGAVAWTMQRRSRNRAGTGTGSSSADCCDPDQLRRPNLPQPDREDH
ncbi:hypothetical protein [Promicromonospora sp. NPDC023987]|uniref:hypothetical protein n=1 Tax=Promicromonospora sp. NPDC023987 TaxID=3155360 RepID=UPI0033F8E770